MYDSIIKTFIFIIVCLILIIAIRILHTTEQTHILVSEVSSTVSGLDIVGIQEVE